MEVLGQPSPAVSEHPWHILVVPEHFADSEVGRLILPRVEISIRSLIAVIVRLGRILVSAGHQVPDVVGLVAVEQRRDLLLLLVEVKPALGLHGGGMSRWERVRRWGRFWQE